MGKHTPLHEEHRALGAKLVDFAGWDMPIHYGSQIDEHKAVRGSAGLFDVSHMAAVDITGPDARAFLRRLWANDVAKVDEVGKALYTCMLNERGGVVDDLIVYHLGDNWYRTVVNAATTAKDLAWMQSQADGFEVCIEHRSDLAIVAVQGPQARQHVAAVLNDELVEHAMQLKPFRACTDATRMVGRTGYTGEDGFELILPAADAVTLWRKLVAAGVTPAGLGARDTLRLEAGLNLYGQDMDEDRQPLESGLGWTVAFKPEDRDFTGRKALQAARAGADEQYKLVGLVLEDRGVMRAGQAVRAAGASDDDAEQAPGTITSGGFAPTLGRSIALARIPADCGDAVEVNMRRKWLTARVVSYPFVRKGKSTIEAQATGP